jgi:hypothetical protein
MNNFDFLGRSSASAAPNGFQYQCFNASSGVPISCASGMQHTYFVVCCLSCGIVVFGCFDKILIYV